MEGFSDLDRLIALADIKQLKARRDHALDLKDWETYAALHAPDHVSHHDESSGGRMGSAAEIAAAVAYLASDEAAYVTGETLQVNGGMAMI